MFFAQILLANVLVPSVVSVGALAVDWLLNKKRGQSIQADESASVPSASTSLQSSLLSSLLGAVAISLAIWLAFCLRNGFTFYAEDAWLRIPIGVLAVAVAGVVSRNFPLPIALVFRTGAVVAATWLIFPTGEAWEFLNDSRLTWFAIIAASTILGWLAVDRMAIRDAANLSLAWILCFIAGAYLSGESFAKVTEPLMAISSVLGCLGLAAIWTRRREFLTAAVGPALFGFSAIVASAQFNSFLGVADSLPFFAIACPALAALLVWPFARRKTLAASDDPGDEKGSASKWGVVAIYLLCFLLSLALASWTYSVLGSGEEEW